ncbi:MAG: hypothetical protein HYT15_04310 [Candidatus Magasanikbacteria bacterium]|nr:hypothetical protein [Candidatus Magasanikbacteria bacterium]
MGGLPSQTQLTDRQKKAEETLSQLKDSYNNFISFWEKFQNEERVLIKDLHKHLDKEKLESVLKHIEQDNQ